MKKSSILTCILTFFAGCVFSSAMANSSIHISDTIEMRKKFGGNQFYENGRVLNMTQLKSRLSQDRQAFSEFKSARTANGIATVLGFTGGALIGWPLGTAIGGGEPEWALLGAGVGLVGVSVPFIVKANKKFKKSVDVYNSNLGNTSSPPAVEFRLGSTGKGVGLVMNF